MDLTAIIPIGAILTLNGALVGVLVVLIKALRVVTETNIGLNNELQDVLKNRLVRQERIAQLSEDMARVQIEFSQYKALSQSQIDALQTEIANLKRELVEAKKEADAMKESIDRLTKALEVANQRAIQLEARENELRNSLKEAREEIATLQRDNAIKDQELNKLTSRVSQLEAELKIAHAERERLENEKAQLQAQIDALTLTAETGEHRPDTPETSENEPIEGA